VSDSGGGTATGSGTDYTATTQTLTFLSGALNGDTQTSVGLLTIVDDNIVEGDETINFGLGGTSDGTGSQVTRVAPTILVVTITDNDNAAPLLDNSGTPTLKWISNTVSGNQGIAISTIVASVLPLDMITDADSGAVEGFAVVGATHTAGGTGKWQYMITGGSWTDVGTVSDVQALLLRPEAVNSAWRAAFLATARTSASGISSGPSVVGIVTILGSPFRK
jgi:hypothetical protein